MTFTATLNNTTGTVSWTLSGPGSIDPATGATTSYTPPASVALVAEATLTGGVWLVVAPWRSSSRLPSGSTTRSRGVISVSR